MRAISSCASGVSGCALDVLLPVRERLALLHADRVVEMLGHRDVDHRLRDADRQEDEAQQRAAERLGERVHVARDARAASLADALVGEQQRIVGDFHLELFAQRGVDVVVFEQLRRGAAIGDRVVVHRVHEVARVGDEAGRRLAGRDAQSLGGLERRELRARGRRVACRAPPARDRARRDRWRRADTRRVLRAARAAPASARPQACCTPRGPHRTRPPARRYCGEKRSRSTRSVKARKASRRRAASSFSGVPSWFATAS